MLAQHGQCPGFHPQHHVRADIVAYDSNPNTQELVAEGSEVQGPPQLRNEVEISLGFMNPLYRSPA